MKELYIDFDGVIMDTIPHLYKGFEKNKLDTMEEKDKIAYFSKFDFSTIIKDENILNDSIECINKLKKSNLFQISILTHINSLEEGIVKVNYIRRYFKDITIILTPKQIEKTDMVHSTGAILVDDYSGNLRKWKEKGGISIRFSEETTKSDFFTIKSLDKLIDLFGGYYES